MATATYLNARGVVLSTTSSPTAVHHNFWAATPGTITTAIGGGHTLFADGFDDTFNIYSAMDQVIVPTGTPGDDTVVDDAWNASYTLAAGVQNLILAGNSQVATGNTLDNLIIAQGSNTTMRGGGGDDVFVCDSNATTIIDPQGSGNDVIYGFVNDLDHVSLEGATQFTDFAAVQAAMTQVGSDVQLNMRGGQTLTFRNAEVGAFVASDFYLPLSLSGMAMTFDDEFNSFNASPSGVGATWSTTLGHGARTLSGNHEAEYYSDSSVGVSPFSDSNGVLAITAAPTNPASNSLGLSYTSGAITTDHSFAQLYGYFEMRAELPAQQGFWPAFWLLPANGTWPPELDAMEQIGSQPTIDFVSAHSGTSNSQTIVGTGINVGDMSQGFHTYGVYWTPTQITWYFDGQEIATAPTPADMNTPMYMTVNLAVGGIGSWPGAPAAGTSAQMLVDYVRAYAYTGQGPVADSSASTNSTTQSVAATAVLGTTSLNFGIVHVDASDTKGLTITNGTQGSDVDLLVGGFSTVGSPYSGSGTLGSGLESGASARLSISLNTSSAGVVDTTATLALASNDPVDGENAVSTPTITLTGTIDNYATAVVEVVNGPSLTGSGTAYAIDLGTVDAQASASVDLSVVNAATGVADSLSGGFRISDPVAFVNSGFDFFAGLLAGQADTGLVITLHSQIAGVFSETITLSAAGSNASAYYGALAKETITVTGTVAPIYQMSTGIDTISAGAGNDTILAEAADINAGDLINGGGGSNLLVLEGGGNFDLSVLRGFSNIETISVHEGIGTAAPTLTLYNYVNTTVDVLQALSGPGGGITINAGANSDIINLGTGSDVVTVGNAGQTVNGGGHDTIYVAANKLGATLNGGGPGSELMITTAGRATLGGNITGFGTLALTQPAGAMILQANAMSGLQIIGSAIGGDTITLGAASQSVIGGGPNEHVEATSAFAGAAVSGLGAGSELEITTGGTVTLNAATGGSVTAPLIVKLDQASQLTLGPMQFITAQGSTGTDTIIAGAANQVLTGGGGGDTLVGYTGGDDIFRDTAGNLTSSTIRNFLPSDSIDLINVAAAHARVSYNAGTGVLSVTDGYHIAAITLAGSFSAGGFSLGSDGGSGTSVLYHPT